MSVHVSLSFQIVKLSNCQIVIFSNCLIFSVSCDAVVCGTKSTINMSIILSVGTPENLNYKLVQLFAIVGKSMFFVLLSCFHQNLIILSVCRMDKCCWRLLALLLVYLLYLVLGAAVFSAIEAPIETEVVDSLREKREQFLEKHKSCGGGAGEVKIDLTWFCQILENYV